jgi:hypothetical protein
MLAYIVNVESVKSAISFQLNAAQDCNVVVAQQLRSLVDFMLLATRVKIAD